MASTNDVLVENSTNTSNNPQIREKWTKQEQKQISLILSKKLGSDYVSTRVGAGGMRIQYIEGAKAIELANKVFGFNGWSSKILEMSTEFLDEQNGRVSVGISCLARVTLKDGTYREVS